MCLNGAEIIRFGRGKDRILTLESVEERGDPHLGGTFWRLPLCPIIIPFGSYPATAT